MAMKTWRILVYVLILLMMAVILAAVCTSPRTVTQLKSGVLAESQAPMELAVMASWRVDLKKDALRDNGLDAEIALDGAERAEAVLLTDGWHTWPAEISVDGNMITAVWHPPDGAMLDGSVGLYILALGRR